MARQMRPPTLIRAGNHFAEFVPLDLPPRPLGRPPGRRRPRPTCISCGKPVAVGPRCGRCAQRYRGQRTIWLRYLEEAETQADRDEAIAVLASLEIFV